MRVVYDHQVFAFQKYGGISRYFVRLAQELLARPGYSAKVVAPLHVNAYLATLPCGVVRGRAISTSPFNQRVARNISKRIAGPMIAYEKPDLIHETYFAARASGPRGVPTVLTVYDMIHERYADVFAHNDPTSTLKRAAVLRADHVLCISQSTLLDLVSYIPEAAGKASVVLLGFDSFAGSERLERGGGKPYLLFVGERQRYKNFAGLLRAYAASERLCREFEIRCFGGGPPTATERALISELDIDMDAVKFVSGDDMALAASYGNAAAFVYPSLYEGFGIPPLEAMSTSCPVVASDQSSIPEICGDAAAYFNPGDTESMRSAIESTVFDDDVRVSLIEKGHERLKAFSWARCASATIEAYEKLL